MNGDPNGAKRSRLLSETSEVTEASETSQTPLLRLDSSESEDDVFRKVGAKTSKDVCTAVSLARVPYERAAGQCTPTVGRA